MRFAKYTLSLTILYGLAFLAFLILHFTTPALPFSQEVQLNLIAPLKGIAFFFIVLLLLFSPIHLFLREVSPLYNLRKSSLVALQVFGGLCILAVPLKLLSMGAYYGEMSFNPFLVAASVYHKRLLSPALAYFIGLKGQVFYWVFSLIINYLLIFLLYMWLQSRQVFLKHWQLLSLCTSSFVIHHFGAVGYPEALMYVILLLLMLLPNEAQLERIALLIACMLTHESSLFILFPFAYLFVNQRYWLHLVLFVAMYGSFWLSSHHFDWVALGEVNHVQGKSGIAWLQSRPILALWGIVFSYKMLWIAIIYGIFMMLKDKEWQKLFFVLFLFCMALFVTLIAIDTSRMMGLSFAACLIVFSFLYSKKNTRLFAYLPYLFALNLVFPSADVVLHCGIQFVKGLYLYGKFFPLPF